MQGKFAAVFWDFGGVITTSPFERFNELEQRLGLPQDFVRQVNARNIHDNAWARLERGDVDRDGFAALFREEARALGHDLDGGLVLECLAGSVRAGMVHAMQRIRQLGLRQACLTNNVRPDHAPGEGEAAGQGGGPHAAGGWTPERVMQLFDQVVESSVEGIRKPEPRFYQRALERVGVAPEQVVYLDDLGINLKPARAMGMTTIKVLNEGQALAELGGHLGESFAAGAAPLAWKDGEWKDGEWTDGAGEGEANGQGGAAGKGAGHAGQ